MPPSSLDAHRDLIEAYLAELPFADELGALTEAMRYSLDGGGKRIRPVLCLATGEAVGRRPGGPAARSGGDRARAHLRHGPRRSARARRRRSPARARDIARPVRRGDGDPQRRRAPRAGVRPRALLSDDGRRPRALARGLGMIGGQFDDVHGGDDDLARRHSLKTGRLFEAAVGSALAVAEVPEPERAPWRSFASEIRPSLPGRGRRARRRRARRRARARRSA